MREILFRGKRLDNGEWVEGFYVHLWDGKGRESHRIYTGCAETDCGDFYPDWFEVDPATVGQYTGLTDKNGKMIFEGDIVRPEGSRNTYQVRWNDSLTGYWYYRSSCFSTMLTGDCNVIGNIHDNPELLKEVQ